MLYDRLVIPTPAGAREKKRWRDNGWEPEAQQVYLDKLGDLAVPIPWTSERRKAWKRKRQLAASLDPYYVTSVQYMLELQLKVPREHIPTGVERVRPIAAYRSPVEFRRQVTVRPMFTPGAAEPGRLAAIIAHDFIVPEDPGKSDVELLRQAVELASDDEFRAKRALFHAWLESVITKGWSEADAVEEMKKRVDDYNGVLRKLAIRKVIKFAFLVTKIGGSAIALPLMPPLAPVIGGTIMAAEYLEQSTQPHLPQESPVAMFYSAGKHFGWK